jgi:hypothetical protein
VRYGWEVGFKTLPCLVPSRDMREWGFSVTNPSPLASSGFRGRQPPQTPGTAHAPGEPWALDQGTCSGLVQIGFPVWKKNPGLLFPAGLEFERWLNATGPPLAEPDLSQGSSLTRPVEALFQLWTAEPLDQAAASASAVDISKWRTFQTALFLDRLLDGSPLPQGGSRSYRVPGRGCGASPALTCPPPCRGGDEPVQVLFLPAGLNERRDSHPLVADRRP